MEVDETLPTKTLLSREAADDLVLECKEWAEGIARAVARAWSLDWKLDGLDGAALEALIFCSRRFDPARGVPFKGYARKRVHEAATDAARKCKGWRKAPPGETGTMGAREISIELLSVFPELRDGALSYDSDYDGNPEMGTRSAIRDLLVGASLVAAKQGIATALPDEALDYKRMLTYVAVLALIHQVIIWRVYWEGISMRTVAEEWETDELNVIREHKELIGFLTKSFSRGKPAPAPRVRPGLKNIELRLKANGEEAPFSKITESFK